MPSPKGKGGQPEALEGLRLALPSKGEMEGPTLEFLADCGLAVERSSARGYTGAIPALPGAVVLFQRAADIPDKVEAGSADLGIAGLDVVCESDREDGDVLLIVPDLGFSRCQLIVAVPDSWLDVSSLADLADLAVEMRGGGQELRVVTRYPRLVQRFLLSRGLAYFRLVEASGALEAAPAIGYADVVADLTSTGTTLRDNHLKPLAGGILLESQACLVGSRRQLRASPVRMELTRKLLEFIEARMLGQGYYSVAAQVPGGSARAVAGQVSGQPELSGVRGLAITPSFAPPEKATRWAVSLVVPAPGLQEAVEALRQIGGDHIAVTTLNYLFQEKSQHYRRLLEALAPG